MANLTYGVSTVSKPKIPNPEIFNSIDKKKYDGQKVKMIHKLKSNTNYYKAVSPVAACLYVASRLEGIALDYIYPRLPG